MDLVERSLLDAGVDLDRIFIERFVVDGEPLPGPAAGDGAAADDEAVPEEVTIVLGGTRTTVAYRPGDTILQTARRGGLSPPFSCEAGNCATCMAMLHQGAVSMRTNNALTPEEVEEGLVLTCQSLPRGQVVEIEYESF
jgi:ferredoxin